VRACRDIARVGFDLAQNAFQLHGATGVGRVVALRKLCRAQAPDFFGRCPAGVLAMETCDDAHLRGRGIGQPGHEVRSIPRLMSSPSCGIKKRKRGGPWLRSAVQARAEAIRVDRPKTLGDVIQDRFVAARQAALQGGGNGVPSA